MSDTPRTDLNVYHLETFEDTKEGFISPHFARQLERELNEARKDKERLEHLFKEAYLPPILEPYVVPPGTVVLCVSSDVPLDFEGYRQAIDSAMQDQTKP